MSISRMKFAVSWLLALAACQGCSTLSEYQSEWALKHRAHQVYKSAAACGAPHGPLTRHYERGWKQGYCDVAEGGNGCPPPVPPEVYWSFKYQNPEGQIAIETWFQAYNDGAQMALADGVQQFNYLPSPHLREPAYRPAFEPASPYGAPPMMPGEIVPPPLAATGSAPRGVQPVVPPSGPLSAYSELPVRLPEVPTVFIDGSPSAPASSSPLTNSSPDNAAQKASYYAPDTY